MEIDLVEIEEKICRTVQRYNRKEVSNAFFTELLQIFPETKDLYESVAYKASLISKFIGFSTIKKESAEFTAYTKNFDKEIEICVTSPITIEKGSSIIVHELGEADYGASQYPYLFDPPIGEMYRIVEIFSHPHIRQLSAKYKLEQIEGRFREELAESYINFNYVEEYVKEWKITLMISWAMITFPEIEARKESIKGYFERKESIEKIIKIRKSVNTLVNNMDEVRVVFEEVIKALMEIGMPDPGKIV